MKLRPINPPLRKGQRVLCVMCKKWIEERDAELANLDGESFTDYYHSQCILKYGGKPT